MEVLLLIISQQKVIQKRYIYNSKEGLGVKAQIILHKLFNLVMKEVKHYWEVLIIIHQQLSFKMVSFQLIKKITLKIGPESI